MIAEIANIARGILQPVIPFIDNFGGLVSTLVMSEENESGSAIEKRFPVSYDGDANYLITSGNYRQFIPDNTNYRGFAYFEHQSLTSQGSTRETQLWQEKMRLVVWYDRQQVNDSPETMGQVIDMIVKALCGKFINQAPYTRIYFKVDNVLSDRSIFAPYTYDEAIIQHLLYPFEYFAIDFTINFRVACMPTFTPNPSKVC